MTKVKIDEDFKIWSLYAYEDKDLIMELYRRGVSEDTVRGAFYALDQIADHKTEVADTYREGAKYDSVE